MSARRCLVAAGQELSCTLTWLFLAGCIGIAAAQAASGGPTMHPVKEVSICRIHLVGS
jgi:hypothetical protein